MTLPSAPGEENRPVGSPRSAAVRSIRRPLRADLFAVFVYVVVGATVIAQAALVSWLLRF
jgi:hypothetical protein